MYVPTVNPATEATAKQWLIEQLGWDGDDFEDVGTIYGENIETILAAFGEWYAKRCIPGG